MTITKSQMDKLPKWAQNEITKLTANVSFWKGKYKVAVGETEPKPGHPFIDTFDDGKIFLPENRFTYPSFDIEISILGSRLEVSSTNGKPVTINPLASNSFTVKGY